MKGIESIGNGGISRRKVDFEWKRCGGFWKFFLIFFNVIFFPQRWGVRNDEFLDISGDLMTFL